MNIVAIFFSNGETEKAERCVHGNVSIWNDIGGAAVTSKNGDNVRLGSVRFGLVRFASVRFGSVLLCSIRVGVVRSGSVQLSSVWFGPVLFS